MIFLQRMAAVFSGNILFAASSLIVASILVSNGDLKSYGLFVVLQACFQTWTIISKPLTWQTIVKYQDAYSLKHLLEASAKLELILTCVSAVALALVFFVVLKFNPDVSIYSWIILIVMIVSPLYNNGTVIGYFRSNRRFYIIAMIQSWMAISRVILSMIFYDDIVLLFAISLSVDAVAWGGGLIYILVMKKRLRIESNKNAVPFVEFTKFSVWGTFHASLDLPLTQLDKVIISSLIGLDVAGVLNLLRKMSTILNQIADPIYQVIFPEFSSLVHNQNFEKVRSISFKITVFILIIGCVVLLGGYLLFDFMNQLLFAEKLVGYKVELLAMMTVQMFAMIFIWIHPLFLSFGFMKSIATILIVANGVFLITLYLLVGEIGIWGVIIAMLAQYFIVITAKLLALKEKTTFFK